MSCIAVNSLPGRGDFAFCCLKQCLHTCLNILADVKTRPALKIGVFEVSELIGSIGETAGAMAEAAGDDFGTFTHSGGFPPVFHPLILLLTS